MDKLHSSLLKDTKAAGQQQLLRFWHELDKVQQLELAEQINALDLKEINSMFSQASVKKHSDSLVEPIDKEMIGKADSPKEITDSWRQSGMAALGKGEVGVILLAGGQGTRLGSDKPKALFDVGLPSKKSLLQIQAERIKKLEELSRGKIVWYVMASQATVNDIKEAFESSNYFGFELDQVQIFCQGSLPCVSEEGDILLSDRSVLATNPDGNGGLFRALKKEGIMEDMKSRGLKHLFMYCVDNILVKVADP